MPFVDQPGPPSAMETLEKLSKLSAARVCATSPRKRVRATLVDGRHSVELRPEGFQELDPGTLAEEVVHAFTGTLRGYQQAERRILSEYDGPATEPLPDKARDVLRHARESVTVTAMSPAKLVRGSWSGSAGVELRIKAVNESHRVPLAEDISAVLNELSDKFRVELRDALAAARRRLREEAAT